MGGNPKCQILRVCSVQFKAGREKEAANRFERSDLLRMFDENGVYLLFWSEIGDLSNFFLLFQLHPTGEPRETQCARLFALSPSPPPFARQPANLSV